MFELIGMVNSMLIYLMMFFASVSCLYLSEKPAMTKYRWYFVFFAVMLPCLVAGLRAQSVGVDVQIYAIPIHQDALASEGLISFLMNQWAIQNKDIAFNALAYLCSRFSSDVHLGLMMYQLLTIVFIYLGMKECNKKFNTPVWLGMLLYYFLLFNPSLNIMRQCIAVSILFYGICCFMNGKWKVYLFMQVLSFFFHSSSILGIGIILMYLMLTLKVATTVKKQLLHGSVFLSCLAFAAFLMPVLLKLFVNLGVLRAYYLEYLPGGIYSTLGNDDGIHILSVMPSLFYLCLMILFYRKMVEEKKEALFLIFCALIVFLLDFSPLYANYLVRVGYYFLPFQAIMLADIVDVLLLKHKMYYIVMIIVAMFVVWYVTVVLLGYYGTYPYEFFWNV